jgi:hypothetical protein
VTPGATYTVNVGAAGAVNNAGGNSSFTDSSSNVLVLAGGGTEGDDACNENACTRGGSLCSSGGTFSGTTSIAHTGAPGSSSGGSACPFPGGAGYSVPTLSRGIGAGGSAGAFLSCSPAPVAISGQSGYALLEW